MESDGARPRRGIVGILTPSGNPTVEPEMVRMLGDDAVMVTARLCSDAPTMLDRLLDYANRIEPSVATFGGCRWM